MRRWQPSGLNLFLAFLIGLALLVVSALAGYPTAQGILTKAFIMAIPQNIDSNGKTLTPNTEYYVWHAPRVFSSDYFDGEILTAEQAELGLKNEGGVSTLKINRDHKIIFRGLDLNKREPYSRSIDYERFGVKVNGVYFFGLDADGQINRMLTVEQALQEPAYIKADIFVDEVRQAEKIVRTEVGPVYTDYWPNSGQLKELRGFFVRTSGLKRTWIVTYSEQGIKDSNHKASYQANTTPFTADIPLKILGIKTDGRYLLSVLPDNSAGFPRPELDALAEQRHIELWVADGQVYRATLITFVTTGENWTSYDKDGNYLKRWGYDIENGRKVEWQQKFDRSVGQRGGEWVPPRPQDQDDD
ncbi:hypothetical protein B0T40_20165 [Chromobacterium haemolyticum]|uniref:hypothetical protein n=1 Tax=Chromobacterium haemolyticum TaxID=394935 RepID=UPI0009DB1E7D|nr:hypothetical protein [Chromobacterium haemolyticum]OQS32224.1 hypothetical protein B0T40_20165 [Chromobacterium haemolyticum]